MGSDARQQQQHVVQSAQASQQPQQPQQLFMSPQTENLSYMYSLVQKLTEQLKTNKEKKEQLLWEVDILSKQLSSRFKKPQTAAGVDFDVVIFQKFLDQRNNLIEKGTDEDKSGFYPCEGADSGTRIAVLKRQHKELAKVLDSKTKLNTDTFSLLTYHEDGLVEIVRHLRAEVLQSHENFIKKVRNKFTGEMILKEDEEFKVYLENIEEVQKLIDISTAYRLLLRLCDR